MRKNGASLPEKLMEKLASASVNDAVKLLYLGEDELSTVDGLELSLLSEIKRSSSGAVEIKFQNKLDILRALAELKRARESEESAGENFYSALERSAALLALEKEKNEV